MYTAIRPLATPKQPLKFSQPTFHDVELRIEEYESNYIEIFRIIFVQIKQ